VLRERCIVMESDKMARRRRIARSLELLLIVRGSGCVPPVGSWKRLR
jgi:hypothetical protein